MNEFIIIFKVKIRNCEEMYLIPYGCFRTKLSSERCKLKQGVIT